MLGELHWNEPASDSLLAKQLGWLNFINKEFEDQVVERRQGYTALSIYWKTAENQTAFQNKLSKFRVHNHELSSKIWELPVCYDPKYGRDLGSLAVQHRLTANELIQLHSSVTYRLHFFGFLPGFMYLNGLSEQLHTPRKPVPDRNVDAGSVAIGGAQTGIYPMESPGGWHLIGRCPVKLFDPEKNPPVWAEPGDRIKFEPIGLDEMEQLLQNQPIPKSQ
ncbi:hypothetical protein GCM10009119_42640 [Algoriphagus jejuensis]|uniref:Carboxyltransferase domain-containing protein n=2 Tax=Algoriphagus jejuensis TaxID=419934 RepID=A0ABP3YJV6_9BACT